MASIFDYSQTPGSNTALFPENQPPSSLNDSARQVQADIAGGVLEVYTTGGSADAYTVTLSPAISSYSTTADLSFMAKIHTANLTTTPTVNVNGLGAKTIKDRAGAALVAGALPTGCVVKFWYDGTDMRAVDIGGGALAGTSLSLSGSLSVGTTSTLTGTVTGPSGTWDSGGMDIASSDTYAINGTDVLSATTLGSGVVNSSLTSLGTIASLVATTADINGGTVDAAAIGATTPSTGAFTTLSATGEISNYGSSGGASNRLKATYNSASGVATIGPDSSGGTTSLELGCSNAGTYATRLTLTSTGLNSTAIGATTPSTGAFTTLSASSTSNLSGGTVTGPSGTWSSTGISLDVGDAYSINGTSVLNGTTLGSGVTASSLTSVGTLSSLTVSGTVTGPSGAWSSTGFNIDAGDAYSINGTSVLNATTLGSGVTASSLTSVGTLTSLTSSGAIASTSTSGGIGYATGAGGTVTQLTSKGTGVTLNKVTGQIVTHNANLNNATNVSFTFTNSSIAATDVVTVALSNGSSHTGGAYQIWVDGVRSGACDISIRNVSGGALAEAMTINFAVIKGVTS
jgi:hypothetical protein